MISHNRQMQKHPSVYIMTNKCRGTLYVGVSSNLVKRVWQHKNHITLGFTSTYGLKDLVYFEIHEDMYEAIRREKAIRNWKRIWKIKLVEDGNPKWKDLYPSII